MKQLFSEFKVGDIYRALRTRVPPVFMLFAFFWVGCFALEYCSMRVYKPHENSGSTSFQRIETFVVSDPSKGLNSFSSEVLYRQKKFVCLWPYGMPENSIGKLGEICVISGEFSQLGNSQYEKYLMSQGIRGKMLVSKIHKRVWPHTLTGLLMNYRSTLIRYVLSQTKSMEGALITALIFGYKTRLSTLQNLFKTIGLSHLLSVSGSHFALAIGFLLIILRICDVRRSLMILISIVFSLCFFYITGMNVATLRACLMASSAQLMFFSRRRIDLLSLISLAGILILLLNPSSACSVSFQLSFAAVIGIALYYGRCLIWAKTYIPCIPHWIAEGVILGLSAQILTIPLTLLIFHTIAPLGVVSTIAVALLFEIVIVCGILLVFIAPFSSFYSSVIMKVAKMSARIIVDFCLALSEIPGMYFQLARRSAWVVSIVFIAFAILLFIKTRRTMRLKRNVQGDNTFSSKRMRLVVSLIAIGVALVGLALPSGTLRSLSFAHKDMRGVYFLNVGQGDATLIRDHGKNVLIDAGPDELALKKELRNVGVSRVDIIVFTHGHEDHVRGAELFTKSTGVKHIVVARGCQNDESIRQISQSTHAAITEVLRGDEILLPSSRIRILSPSISVSDADDNSSCLVVEFNEKPEHKGRPDVVITGDAEAETLQDIIREQNLHSITLLKLGHHGSKRSINEHILNDIKISRVVISVGENSYGHPNKTVLALLQKFRIPYKRTDVSGTIFYRSVAQ